MGDVRLLCVGLPYFTEYFLYGLRRFRRLSGSFYLLHGVFLAGNSRLRGFRLQGLPHLRYGRHGTELQTTTKTKEATKIRRRHFHVVLNRQRVHVPRRRGVLPRLLDPVTRVDLRVSFCVSVSIHRPSFMTFCFRMLVGFTTIVRWVAITTRARYFSTYHVVRTININHVVTYVRPRLSEQYLLRGTTGHLHTTVHVAHGTCSRFFLLRVTADLQVTLPQ